MRAPFIVARRDLVLQGSALAGGLLPACAPAAVPPAGGAAIPCLGRAGDIVGLLLEGQGAPAGTVAVFGQVFRPGDLPQGAALGARLADGRPVPVQIDVNRRHPDGSARFGVVSLAPAAAIAARQRVGIVLTNDGQRGTRPPPLDFAAALAGRQVFVDIAPAAGGQTWRVDLVAMAGQRPTGASVPWQSGPLAHQTRIVVPVPPQAVGGARSVRLVADLAARADGTVWVDAWLRNDITMQPGGGLATYSLRVVLDGREALRAENLRHFHYTGFGRLLGSARGGGPAPAPPHMRHDLTYLADTGAVARYDLSVGMDAGNLTWFGERLAEPAWAAPFGARQIERRMPNTGGRGDIGPATAWQACWLVTGDPRTAAFCIGQAEAAGSVPWHHWDPLGSNGAGSWLDVRRWPLLWTDGRGGHAPTGLGPQWVPNDSGWEHDSAHQPDLSYVPYVMTGRRAFLDGLQAQAAWNVMGHWPMPRGDSQANMVRGHQTRGTAWALRQLHEAGWISPDDDQQRAYFQMCEKNNWSFIRSQIPAWTRAQGETYGRIASDWSPAYEEKPWQQDYLCSTVAAAARKGDEDARAVLAYMSNFLVGRFLSGDKGFNPRDGVAYTIGATDANKVPHKTWAAIGAQTRALGWSNGEGWSKSEGVYPQLAMASLALIVEVLRTEESRRAYAWLIASGAPFTQVSNFAKEPAFSIVPRGQPRVPGRMPQCAR